MTDTPQPVSGEALLPCPFCGGKAEEQIDRGRNTIGVGCTKCTANHPPSWDLASREWAIAAWNARPSTPLRASEVDVQSIAAAIYAEVADEPLGDLTQRRPGVQRRWHNAVRTALTTPPQDDGGMREADLDRAAKAMAAVHRLDWDEVCAIEAGADECESSTCIASYDEDHEPHGCRESFRAMARAALTPGERA